MRTRILQGLAAFAVTASVLALAPTATAQASASNHVVDGSASTDWSHDLEDEATLSSNGTYWHSNYAALWQAMLWSEGLLTQSQVDCQFGPMTAAATRAYQQRYGLNQTGQLDRATLQTADSFLSFNASSSEGVYIQYNGTGGHYILIHRRGSGVAYRWDVDLWNEWHGAWYTSASYAFC